MSNDTQRHRRTPNASKSIDLGALLRITPIDHVHVPVYEQVGSPPSMQRRISDTSLLSPPPSASSSSEMRMSAPSTPSLLGSSRHHDLAQNRVKRSCSTSALSHFTASSGTTAATAISECPSVRSFSKKAKALVPALDKTEQASGDMAARSRSESSASALSDLYTSSQSRSRPSSLISQQQRSSSRSRFSHGSQTPPILSPSASSAGHSSEPTTPALWTSSTSHFFSLFASDTTISPVHTGKRNRSSTIDALSGLSVSSRSTAGQAKTERPSKLRNVASCAGIFGFTTPDEVDSQSPLCSPTYQGRRASYSHALVPRTPLSPISSSSLSPPPASGPASPVAKHIESITVRYSPSQPATAQKCKKLLIALEKANRQLSNSASPPATPGFRKIQKTTSHAFRIYAKVGTDGLSGIEVAYSDSSRSALDPSAIEYEQLLSQLHLPSSTSVSPSCPSPA